MLALSRSVLTSNRAARARSRGIPVKQDPNQSLTVNLKALDALKHVFQSDVIITDNEGSLFVWETNPKIRQLIMAKIMSICFIKNKIYPIFILCYKLEMSTCNVQLLKLLTVAFASVCSCSGIGVWLLWPPCVVALASA